MKIKTKSHFLSKIVHIQLNMRLKHILTTLLLTLSYFSQGQFLHTPEEMEEKVSSRPDKYVLQETNNLSIEAFQNCRGGTNNHNVQAMQVAQVNSSLTQNLSKAARKKLKKKNKRLLKQVDQSKDDEIIRQLCSNYYQLGNFDEALFYKLLLPAKDIKSFDNELFLAKSYYETKKHDLAFEHAFNAKLLLPYAAQSNKQLEIEMVEGLLQQILTAQQKTYAKWTLQFSYCITNRDHKTYISFKSEPWKTYAVCKSVWLEDEKHKQKMSTISDQSLWLIEEKECLLNALVSYMRHEKDNPEFVGISHLADALDEDYVKEYILYEIYISQYIANPDGMPSKDNIAKLRAYFLKAHSVAHK